MRPGSPSSPPIPVAVPRELEADRAAYLTQLAPLIEGGALPPDALSQLDRYALLLYERIPTLALISKNDRGSLYTRHILDSLNPLSLFPSPPECLLDIGSGGGLPGIPLAIVWPGTRAILLEAREKKAAFLERTVRMLRLKNVRVACERLEEHAKKGMPVYDALFIRAVAEIPRLIDEMAPSCRPGARWVYFAGGGIDREKLAADLATTGRSGTESIGLFGGRLLHGPV
ncbi:MAG TPA: 16S rRNA (guanine(527)-N(7))-methyltransferase RsmG [Candidatus Eisenbacteria bacterium]|nr:16S rRNA (guanine(527)-N(7))-methyltransferase RsmG [Candidatus Eisenbacteria bacterium]